MQGLPQILETSNVHDKLAGLAPAVNSLLRGGILVVPETVARDVEVRGLRELPEKPALTERSGVGRLLHDLASIELQAMEIMLRTLYEYPEAPREFRERLGDLILDEGRHLELCLKELIELEQPWGTWPVHIGLWQCIRLNDPLLSRILIVHRYLEGSGLDAAETLLRRLSELRWRGSFEVINTIYLEEKGHVLFGSQWYKKICAVQGLDPDIDFKERSWSLRNQLPRRLEPINRPTRRQAGFSDSEIAALECLQSHFRARPNQSDLLRDRI